MIRVLIVAKYATIDRLTPVDLERLLAAGANRRERLEAGRASHEATVEAVVTAFAGEDVRLRRVDQVYADDAHWAELVVTVGGDGTVFAVHRFLADCPVLSINSDPDRSVGHFTRFPANEVVRAVELWRSDRLVIWPVARLGAAIEHRPAAPMLNDCLFTSANPAAMTRYLLEEDDQRELHWSSGVWIATVAGATGAIASAGCAPPHPSVTEALLYRVREPFAPRHPYRHIEGIQAPPRGLALVAGMSDVRLFIDGKHASHDVRAGERVWFSAYPHPLRLLEPPA